MSQFKDKIILITGTNRGIGEALLKAVLAESPSKVYATARDINSIKIEDEKIEKVQLDLLNKESIEKLSTLGKIDVLINNAGVFEFNDPLESPDNNILVNYYGTLAVTKAVLSNINSGGSISTVSSIIALAPMAMVSGYSAGKAALHSMIQSWRSVLKDRDISVTGIYPGAIDTDMTKNMQMEKADVNETAIQIVKGINEKQDYIFPDKMSQEMGNIYLNNPRKLEEIFANFGK